MITKAAIPAIFAVLAVGVVADASAWERKGSFAGPRGTSTVEGSGTCAGGACSRNVIKTGPYGRSFSRQGSGSCADGSCSGSRTTSGPNGQSWTREGS
ncbi:MAG: hypothetical protein AAF698_09895, partial [Pseudomonadota bacterium]